MAPRRYKNSRGDTVSFDDLDEAEQEYYSKSVQADLHISGIGIEDYCRNFWRGNAIDSEPDDDD